jgi:hypothetical protein
MGTTFVSGQPGNGFWMNDSVLELWLRFAALHITDSAEDHSLAYTIRNEWLLASRGYFNGCVPLSLDENVSTSEGKAVVLDAINSLLISLRQAPELLDRRVFNLMGFSGEFVRDIESWRLVEVSEAIVDLINGKQFGNASTSLPMPGSGPPYSAPSDSEPLSSA